MEISLATSRWISACELLTDVQMLVWTAASLEAPFHFVGSGLTTLNTSDHASPSNHL